MIEIVGKESGVERIRAKKTLQEVLEVAASFEESARNFYRDLTPKVSKQIRWVVEDLAKEEQRHFDMFSELSARTDIAGQIREQVDTPATDTKFSDCIHLPDLGENPDDQAVLQYAMGREQIAMEHYRELAEGTEDGPIKDLFDYLSKEELEHKKELEKLYYQTVHSGGV